MKNWHLGNYLSSFPQEILLDWDGPNSMGSFSALWRGAVCLRQRTDKAIREKAQCELGLKKSDEQYVVIEK